MSSSAQLHLEGSIYYITVVVYDRLAIFTQPAYITPLYDSLNYYRHKREFKLLGYVIMPDHLHLLIWPHNDGDLGETLREFKTFTAKRLIAQAEVERNHACLERFANAGNATQRCRYKVWQDGVFDVGIYTERFLRQKLNYMHRNPVRAGIVQTPEAYPYSSYRNYALGEEWFIKIDRGWS